MNADDILSEWHHVSKGDDFWDLPRPGALMQLQNGEELYLGRDNFNKGYTKSDVGVCMLVGFAPEENLSEDERQGGASSMQAIITSKIGLIFVNLCVLADSFELA